MDETWKFMSQHFKDPNLKSNFESTETLVRLKHIFKINFPMSHFAIDYSAK